MKKVAIVGSRDYPHLEEVRAFVRRLARDTIVVTGGARGVDLVAEDEARRVRLSRIVYEPACEPTAPRAEYTKALLRRNDRIVEEADEVVAFHDGSSHGTAYTIAAAKRRGRVVTVIVATERRA